MLKLTNNILSAVAFAATAEAFVMAAKGGLDPEVMLPQRPERAGRPPACLRQPRSSGSSFSASARTSSASP
jgi:3-hydroxyisobutyrate dehydrogenase-like beta-hydroxyacid dehydrogenase